MYEVLGLVSRAEEVPGCETIRTAQFSQDGALIGTILELVVRGRSETFASQPHLVQFPSRAGKGNRSVINGVSTFASADSAESWASVVSLLH